MNRYPPATNFRVDKTGPPIVATADVATAPEEKPAMLGPVSSQRELPLRRESSMLTIGEVLRASHVQALSMEARPHKHRYREVFLLGTRISASLRTERGSSESG